MTTLIESGLSSGSSMAARSAQFLLENQLDGGRWQASPFIQMDTLRAQSTIGLARPRIISYGSSTLASALCLKALSRYSRIC